MDVLISAIKASEIHRGEGNRPCCGGRNQAELQWPPASSWDPPEPTSRSKVSDLSADLANFLDPNRHYLARLIIGGGNEGYNTEFQGDRSLLTCEACLLGIVALSASASTVNAFVPDSAHRWRRKSRPKASLERRFLSQLVTHSRNVDDRFIGKLCALGRSCGEKAGSVARSPPARRQEPSLPRRSPSSDPGRHVVVVAGPVQAIW